MDNKTEYFTLNHSGLILWIENMPEVVNFVEQDGEFFKSSYDHDLQSAISNAIPVANQKEVFTALCKEYPMMDQITPQNQTYSLQCHVEKKEERRFKTGPNWSNWYPVEPLWATDLAFQSRTLAHVTFSEPPSGVEETQEEREALNDKLWWEFLYDVGCNMRFLQGETGPDEPEKMRQFLESKYTITITRKNNGNN